MAKIKKFFKNSSKRKLKCTGCGRHEKEVLEETTWYFCNHCVQDNNNYGRFKAGLPLIKPVEKLKVGDTVIDSNGKPYLIIRESRTNNEDKWFICKELFGKGEEIEMGDYMFYKKTGKRELNKINKAIDSGDNLSSFVTNYEDKQSCLQCKNANKECLRCTKKDISLLDSEADSLTCEFFKQIK